MVRLTKKKIEEVDVDPTEINPGIFHDKIPLNLVRYFFTNPAWNRFQSFYEEKKNLLKYHCTSCSVAASSYDDLISCQHCLKCFHYKCSKLKATVRRRKAWFCKPCQSYAKSSMLISTPSNPISVCDEMDDKEDD